VRSGRGIVLPQLDWLRQTHLDDTLFQASGTWVSPSQTPLPLLWVQANEPENFKKIAHVILSKDYVRYCLTGELTTDLTDASGTLLLDNRTGAWNRAVIDKLGLVPEWFPTPAASAQIVGTVLPDVARELGLPAHVPVVAGSGALIGAVVVGAASAFMGYAMSGMALDYEPSGADKSKGVAAFGIAGGLVGALFGGAIGSVLSHWSLVSPHR